MYVLEGTGQYTSQAITDHIADCTSTSDVHSIEGHAICSVQRMYVLEGIGQYTAQAATAGKAAKEAPVLALYRTDDGRFVCDTRTLQANF